MSGAEDYHPETVGISQYTPYKGGMHWAMKLKDLGTVYMPAKDVRNYDKFCGVCAEQLGVIFDPMRPPEWITLLAPGWSKGVARRGSRREVLRRLNARLLFLTLLFLPVVKRKLYYVAKL